MANGEWRMANGEWRMAKERTTTWPSGDRVALVLAFCPLSFALCPLSPCRSEPDAELEAVERAGEVRIGKREGRSQPDVVLVREDHPQSRPEREVCEAARPLRPEEGVGVVTPLE